jgi:alpha-D-xyloside xylohydrolase
MRLSPSAPASTFARALVFTVLPGILLCALPHPLSAQAPRLTTQPGGITLTQPGNTIRLQVISDAIVHVTAAPLGAPQHPSITVVATPATSVPFKTTHAAGATTLSTSRLKVRVDDLTGAVTFLDRATGAPILAEATRSIVPAVVQGEATTHVQQTWKAQADESLHGLGQMQLGLVDVKGYDLDLWQHNTNVTVPYLVSSRGYGIFWNNTSFTRFGDLRPFEDIPAYALLDTKDTVGGLTLTYPGTSERPARTSALSVNFTPTAAQRSAPDREWNGNVLAPATGDYLFRAYSNGGIKVWIDGKMVMDHWRQAWLTADDLVKVHLNAGQKVSLRILTDGEQQTRMNLQWKTPASTPDTSLWSEVGDAVDYYFVYGPSLDRVVSGYRTLTGKATMMPNWIFGLWQSRQRYETAQQSLDVVHQFRQRNIPFDNIVQDWQYWKPDSWGSHEFDATRFPDPKGWIDAIHAQHAHLMISVWGKFNPNTENAKEMQAHGFLYQEDLKQHLTDWIGFPYTFYDAFNPGARKLFWSQMDNALFKKGVDAWWMDASEPDLLPGEPPATVEDAKAYMNPTAMGTGARMLSGWGLMNSNAVYTGQREEAPNQRVFILTRSGYAGQQRFSTATWSGDITSTWTSLAKQIPAGLGISIAGVPYWTTDTAGYTMQSRFAPRASATTAADPADEDEFRELNARWFQFSTFTPMLRVHGEVRPREMWNFGEDSPVYTAEVKSDRLRYHLMPYLYSLAGAVTQHDGTIMRPLVMDFPADRQARSLTDEYMFGPQLLVAPILHYKQRSREVYLPVGATWYNLWSGAVVASGTQTAEAPYDTIPVFVRAGSILPLGPDVQYVNEKPDAPITLHLFTGANGTFTLYEDQGTTFDYEHGAFTEIPITWNEATRTLTIGQRKGSFPEMPKTRTFHIVLTSPTAPVGFSFTPTPNQSIAYNGAPVTLNLP